MGTSGKTERSRWTALSPAWLRDAADYCVVWVLCKLTDAFDPSNRFGFPWFRELDLYVTATDLRGLSAPIMTSDGSIDERIYKQVFHFEKRDGDTTAGDFAVECNPMLAFASRCTSSFPAAFEPMTLELLEACRQAEGDQSLPPGFQVQRWGKFFSPYLPNAADETFGAELAALQRVEFADGGYLDNRPFGYATATIATRNATGPVERRLLFIDPSPETSGAKAVDHRSHVGAAHV